MDIIRGMGQLKAQHHGCVLTIGNFDGVHLGHQAILGQLAQKSGELSLPLTVMTFEPYPLEYFNQAACPARLTRFREKAQALLRYSVDRLLCLKFNQDLAAMSAETFIETLLVKALGVKYLVVGDDFHFGHKRLGDFALLKQAGQKFGFKVVNMRSFTVDGQRVSSTLIRRALAFGKLSEAEKFLGRPYRMSGRVVYGDGLGQQLGFPTANILLHRHNSPVKGIYTVEVFGLDNEPLQAVASVGTRPTVGGRECILEVHLLNYNKDLYGRYLQIDFLHFIREEMKFNSIEALKKNIQQDIEKAQSFFSQRTQVRHSPSHLENNL